MDCCFGKLNDLNQTQPDCAAILENAMTLTILLPAKLCASALWRSKSLLILKITYLKVQLILLAVSVKVQAHECSFSVVRSTSDLGHARWMLLVYTRVYLMLYWTDKQECRLQYAFLIPPTQTYRVFLISPFPEATSQDPLHHNTSFLKYFSYFACLNYSQGYKHCPITEVVLRGLVPK